MIWIKFETSDNKQSRLTFLKTQNQTLVLLSHSLSHEMATNIGMMDSAYFVGRSEILSWINSTLQLSLSKVEEVNNLGFRLIVEFQIGVLTQWFFYYCN